MFVLKSQKRKKNGKFQTVFLYRLQIHAKMETRKQSQKRLVTQKAIILDAADF